MTNLVGVLTNALLLVAHSNAVGGDARTYQTGEILCITTNVTTEFGKGCRGCAPWSIQRHDLYCPELDLPLNTKRETTEIVEMRAWRQFQWRTGDYIVVPVPRLLSRKVRRWERREEWVEIEEGN